MIGINTAFGCDIHGNVNSTHINGTHMNGIGGSAEFARNAYFAIFVTKSLARNGPLSRVVPMVAYVDHNEHDVEVIATETGLVDLRGLAQYERPEAIIRSCIHPTCRERPPTTCVGHPARSTYALPSGKAFSWHIRARQTGTMLPSQKANRLRPQANSLLNYVFLNTDWPLAIFLPRKPFWLLHTHALYHLKELCSFPNAKDTHVNR